MEQYLIGFEQSHCAYGSLIFSRIIYTIPLLIGTVRLPHLHYDKLLGKGAVASGKLHYLLTAVAYVGLKRALESDRINHNCSKAENF